MRLPEGERLDDALDAWHDNSWDCPGGKPQVSAEQLAHALVVLAPWYRREFEPRQRTARASKPAQTRRPQQASGSSSRVPARIREAVLQRDGRMCQRCGVSLYGRRYSLQHRDNRGMGGSKRLHTMANLVALCGSGTTDCHGHVEAEPTESDRLGWSVPNGVTPEEWPVLRFGKRWEQPGDKWEPSEPHERQIEMGAVA